MLYHLLFSLRESFSWLNVFQYITFRAMVAFLFTFVFVLVSMPLFIRRLKHYGLKGQPIRQDGPKAHESKSGTPTMGGLPIVAGVLSAALLFCDLTQKYVWFTVVVMLGFALIGLIDDWRKITQQSSAGLSERQKLLCQSGVAAFAALMLLLSDFPSALTVPFFKEISIPLSILFIPFVVLVVIGCSNAVNLTDGLDGLAIGPIMTVAFTYGIFAYASGHAGMASYLALPFVPGVGEICIILAAIVAGGLGFLWYNTFPAQVFMGDLGALSLGAVLGFCAVLVKQELLLVITGGIFVLEALSVIIQRYSFKLTGKRVFRMAPIHHHFELKGWAEPKIIVRFWIISIVLAILSLTTLKLR
ncbi:MAG: phospho-N-acetylmuramoyl-pentapeptide-transferase [Bdellovibrionota bacterium]|nr:MAG: phospho-N-acetylmuramoyl-pentapeptide-transferase [Bdellovibrionota bacterium]